MRSQKIIAEIKEDSASKPETDFIFDYQTKRYIPFTHNGVRYQVKIRAITPYEWAVRIESEDGSEKVYSLHEYVSKNMARYEALSSFAKSHGLTPPHEVEVKPQEAHIIASPEDNKTRSLIRSKVALPSFAPIKAGNNE